MSIYKKSDDDLLEHIHGWLKDSRDASKSWRKEAKENENQYAGKQWSDDDEEAMAADFRATVTFNRIGALVDAVCGHQINNRAEVRFLPRQIGDANVSEVLTGAGAWVEDEADTEDEEEEVFRDLLITGMGWSECRLSYDDNLDGQVIPGERFSPMEAYWDANSSRRNLADSKWRARGRWMDRHDAVAQWPELEGMDLESDRFMLEDDEAESSSSDDYKEAKQYYRRHKDEVFVVQTQWWEFEAVHRVGDPATGKLLEFSASKFAKLKDMLDQMGVQHVRQQKKCFYQAFVCGPRILEKGKNSWPDGFTLQCVTGKRDSQKQCWFGFVRPIVEPQKWTNKFLADLQDMIVSNRQGGAFVEETALVDSRRAEADWNKANPLILVRDGALGRGAIQERTPPPMPPAVDRMLEWCINAIPAVSGINQEFMGYAGRDQPGVLEMQRKRAAINVLAVLFSSLRKYRKDRARAMLYMIREYLNDGRLIRVLGGDGKEQFIPLALNQETEDYDIIIDEASASPNQKEETFGVILSLAPFLAQAGLAPPIETLDYLPLPSSLIAAWKEQLQPKGPSPQEQATQAVVQAEVAKTQAQTVMEQAKARRELAEAEAQEIENMAVKMGLVSIEDL